MQSGATHHFPAVKLQSDRKVLWNRLERKTLVNRPEERVRLQFVDYLTLQCGWPESRIASELSVTGGRQRQLRADLIGYNKTFDPEFLVECKAESVSLTPRAAQQIALYNREVKAPYLCITNGLTDYWFQVNDRNANPLQSPPVQPVKTLSDIYSDIGYWQLRGFAGSSLPGRDEYVAAALLSSFWSDSHPWMTTYLQIGKQTPELLLDHHYRILPGRRDDRIAATLMAGRRESTWLVAICMRYHEVHSLLCCDLASVDHETPGKGWVLNDQGQTGIDPNTLQSFSPGQNPATWVDTLPELLDKCLYRDG